ncbi:MAG: hypothetical protein KF757_07615 [Phycisphaeraceae bacterium]|nr:hypothetical protein [Phycisphaeraceae bacterium]MCW5762624.1 hypothetical protein [Phycisphaeraceae bacterium]
MTDHKAGGSGAWDEQFDAVLSRIAEMYGQLDALSSQQDVLLEREDIERLLVVLAERQNLIIDLESTMPEFDARRRQWEEFAGRLTEMKRTAFARRLEAIEKMAQTIADRDARTAQMLDLKREAIAQSLSDLGRGNAAVTAYDSGTRPEGGPRFQDRKG